MSNFIEKLTPERRILVATTLCIFMSVLFTVLFPPKPKPRKEAQTATQNLPSRKDAELKSPENGSPTIQSATSSLISQATQSVVQAATPTLAITDKPFAAANPNLQVKEVTIDTPRARIVFSTQGGNIRSYRLKEYAEIDPPVKLLESQRDSATSPDLRDFWQKRIEENLQRQELFRKKRLRKGDPVPESAWVELVSEYADTSRRPLNLVFGKGLSDSELLYEASIESKVLAAGETVNLVLKGSTKSGLTLTKSITINADDPKIALEILTEAPNGLKGFQDQWGKEWVIEWPDGLGHLPFQYPGAQEENFLRALLNDSMQSQTNRDWMRKQALSSGSGQEYRYPLEGRIGWICIETRYFIATLIPQGASAQGVYLASDPMRRPVPDTRLGIGLKAPFSLEPQKFVLYAGPKLTSTLTELGGGLDRVVYDSWFGSICLLVEWLLAVFYSLIPSYGLAIVLLCIFSKIILYPLTYKQAQMQIKMAELQPKIQELKEKFKDDAQKLSQEQMKLWKKHGVNPASGCLPMLAQLPIFIALYRTIQSSIDLRGAPCLWIPDLSLPDMTFFIPMSLPFLGNAINVMPIIMTLVSLWQMKEQKKMMPDPNQAQMMMFMTIFFFFILYHFSSGLVIYWLTNSLTQMIQQKVMEHLGHATTPAQRLAANAASSAAEPDGAANETANTESENTPAPQSPLFRRTTKPGRKKSGKS